MSYERAPEAEMYLPYRQYIFGAFMSTIVVRTSGEPLSLVATLSKEVWAVDPNQPIVKVETMNDVIANSIWRPRFSAWILSVLGGLALLLTSAGVYGVVAYTAGLRTREVGIRVALGARPRDAVAMILRSALIPLAAGLAVSVVAALLLSRLLGSLLYEISGTDPVTYFGRECSCWESVRQPAFCPRGEPPREIRFMPCVPSSSNHPPQKRAG